MNPPRHILAATDFSACAQQAVERAARLASAHNSELSLLHVINQGRLTDLARMLNEQLDLARAQAEEAALRDLREQVSLLAHRHSVYPQALKLTGAIATSIVQAGELQHADLLVLGARGNNPVRDFLLGSNAERVLRKASRSMLVVRRDASTDYRQVLVPTDFSADSRKALLLACALAPRATITALHVFDAPLEAKLEFAGVAMADINAYREQGKRQAEADLHAFLGELPEPLRQRMVPEVAVGYPPGVILETARALGIELIAIGKHGSTPVEEWVLGSVTAHILQHATCDVLVTERQSDPSA